MTNFPEKTFNKITIVDQPPEPDDSTLVPTTNWVRNVLRKEYDLTKYLKLSDTDSQTVTGNVVFDNIDVADVTDWTSKQAVNAVTSDSRYIRSNDSNSQTITSIILVPEITDFTNEQILGAKTADARYVKLNSSSTQTVTSNLNFIGSNFSWKNSVNGGNSKISFTGTDTGITSLNFFTNSSSNVGASIIASGGGTLSGLTFNSSSVMVPRVTNWSVNQAVDAVSADNRYLRLNNTSVQTVSGPVTFSGVTNVVTQPASDSSTKAASTAFVTSGLNTEIENRTTAITNEATIRANADTNLNNTKLNISGGTITGNLIVNGSLLANGNSSRVYNSAANKWGNIYIDNSGNYTFDLQGGSPSNSSGNLSWLRLYPDGNLRTNLGTVAFNTIITTSGDVNTPGSYTIFKTPNPSTPSGFVYRIVGISQQIYGEGDFVVTFPITLSGIYPGCYGATEYFYNAGQYESHDTTVAIVTAPTTTTMTLNCNQSHKPWTDFPISALWWIEGY